MNLLLVGGVVGEHRGHVIHDLKVVKLLVDTRYASPISAADIEASSITVKVLQGDGAANERKELVISAI